MKPYRSFRLIIELPENLTLKQLSEISKVFDFKPKGLLIESIGLKYSILYCNNINSNRVIRFSPRLLRQIEEPLYFLDKDNLLSYLEFFEVFQTKIVDFILDTLEPLTSEQKTLLIATIINIMKS